MSKLTKRQRRHKWVRIKLRIAMIKACRQHLHQARLRLSEQNAERMRTEFRAALADGRLAGWKEL